MAEMVPGTIIHLRVTRRFASYNIGELISEPVEAARELVAKRLAVTVGTMAVPTPRETAPPVPPDVATPARAPIPAQVVRK